MTKIKIGSDFTGVGSLNQALMRLGIEYEEVFACEMDKYARQTFIHNYGEPYYYPTDVYEREIAEEPLDLYVTTPPCQAFSLAGNRKGEEDKRGILFYNSHEFIQKNRPRFFMFENVKGLISDNGGKTFQRWVDLLGGKSVNGNPVIFPHEDSVPYHIYYKILNAKNYGVPQNRERIFIIGIRDDQDNNFSFPKEIQLEKKLRDVLETFETSEFETEECFNEYMGKYFISDYYKNSLIKNQKGNGGNNRACDFITEEEEEVYQTIIASYFKSPKDIQYLKVKSANTKGYEIAEIGEDSINLEHPNSETRRGRVGKGVAQTLTTSCNQGVVEIFLKTKKCFLNTYENSIFDGNLKHNNYEERSAIEILFMLQKEIGKKAIEAWGLRIMEVVCEKEILQQILYGARIQKQYEKRPNRNNNTNEQIKSSNVIAKIIMQSLPKEKWNRCSSHRRKSIKQLVRELNESMQKLSHENSQTNINMQCKWLQCSDKRIKILRETLSEIKEVWESINYKENERKNNFIIRKLTPREAFRLMDFPNTFDFSVVSDSQAYKQAGNSVVVQMWVVLLKQLFKI